MKAGDSNTAFFHNKVKDRHNINKIISLLIADGRMLYEVSDIQQEAFSVF